MRGGSYFKKATRKSSRKLKIELQTFLNIINRIRRQSRTSPRKRNKRTDIWQKGEKVRK